MSCSSSLTRLDVLLGVGVTLRHDSLIMLHVHQPANGIITGKNNIVSDKVLFSLFRNLPMLIHSSCAVLRKVDARQLQEEELRAYRKTEEVEMNTASKPVPQFLQGLSQCQLTNSFRHTLLRRSSKK